MPIAASVGVIGFGCLAARRIEATATARSITARISARVAPIVRARWRAIVGWTLALGWFLLLDIAFARNQATRGLSFLSLAQWRAYAATWLTPITVAAACSPLGGLIAIWSAARGRLGPRATPVVDLTVAAVCSMPLVLLVVAVGEPPRNYLAQIGVVVALGSCGWIWLAERLASRVGPRWERARGSRREVLFGVAGGRLSGHREHPDTQPQRDPSLEGGARASALTQQVGRTAVAAPSMTVVTSSGWETITRWEALISVMSAPARVAME